MSKIFVWFRDLIPFIILSLVITFFLSHNSPLYDVVTCDSNWFFMCGKAWMNGMLPYVDFTDSKGPLLWLIYGLGYLLSPYDMHGVWIVEILFGSVTYLYLYKIAFYFLKDKKKSVLCLLFAMVWMWWYHIHKDTRAEDFMWTFLVVMLYHSLTICSKKVIYADFIRSGISIGGCIGCVLLIKYNISVGMFVVFLGVLGWYLYGNQKSKAFYFTLLSGLGFMCVVIPFIILFLIKGNLNDFIYEYFLATAQTISNIEKTVFIWDYNSIIVLTVIFGAGVIVLFYMTRNFSTILFGLCYVAILICLSPNLSHIYYFQILLPFLVIPCITFMLILSEMKKLRGMIIGIVFPVFLLALFIVLNKGRWNDPALYCNGIGHKMDRCVMETLMKRKKSPLILNCGFYSGLGLESHALPACKYWATQNGATENMLNDIKSEIINNKKIDFLIVSCSPSNKWCLDLVTTHYVKLYEGDIWDKEGAPVFVLYERKENDTK